MQTNHSDVLVIGSGMGGMSAATLLANDGFQVRVLEGDHLPGGSSSTYYRKGYWFETGATTLIGFDEDQPLARLENKLDIRLPREEINPPMMVWMNDKSIIRYKNRHAWIKEAAAHFGNFKGQQQFWQKAYTVADTVWKVSARNPFFPPRNPAEWISLVVNNNPADAPVLRYGLMSVRQVARKCGVDTPDFIRFLDEQLIITAQSGSEDTPFLFGAAGLTYTNYSNYYVRGGLIQMIRTLKKKLETDGGELKCKKRVTNITKEGDIYRIRTNTGEEFSSSVVISNVPVWNMPELVDEPMKSWFNQWAEKYDHAWGAVNVAVATDDTFPDDLPLHHQFHVDHPIPNVNSDSLFVSLSMRGDHQRAPEGRRVISVSCHTKPEFWFQSGNDYQKRKNQTESFILEFLNDKLPGFRGDCVNTAFSATPVTWEKWIYRKFGRVGGIPQSMNRSLLDWTPAQTPFEGFFMTGDTVFPGQGIPGVTLSGINVFYRVRKAVKSGMVSVA